MTAHDNPEMKYLKERAARHVSALWEKNFSRETGAEFVVCTAGKGIVAQPTHLNWDFIFYPQARHAAAFAASTIHLLPGGPARRHIGAVGAISTTGVDRPTNGTLRFFMQGTHRQDKSVGLTRSMVTKYGGWREHLLDKLFEKASSQGIGRMEMQVRAMGGQQNPEIFRKIAKKHGWAIALSAENVLAAVRSNPPSE